MSTTQASVPVFKLYGEQLDWPTPDLLHCESIPARSSLYDWEIKPHRHGDLLQLFYVQAGQASVEIEGRRHGISRPSIQLVPPLSVHGFNFSADIQGYVLTLAAPLVRELEAGLASPSSAIMQPACYPLGQDQPWLDGLFASLLREYADNAPGRDLLLRSLVNLLMVWIARQGLQRSGEAGRQARGHEALTRFSGLVEAHYRQHWSVEDYAGRVGISVAYLNSLCRRLTGQTALQMIHQRLLLEAKRELIYTVLTVSRISDHLGFSDPAYFSRFFRRLEGQTPNQFRRSRLEAASVEE